MNKSNTCNDTFFSGRLIYSPVSNLSDYDDVRSYAEAASRGIKRALKAGVKEPLLVLPICSRFPESQLVTLLGALEALYVVSIIKLLLRR